MKNLKGGLLILLSSLLQQESIQSKSPYRPLLSLLSFFLEIFSLYLLPLSNFILLGSLHIVSSTYLKSFHSKIAISPNKTFANLSIILGCVISLIYCSEQQTLHNPSQFNANVNGLYYLWMLSALILNVSMRKCGFYAGRCIFETCIPAQIATIGISAMKMLLFSYDLIADGERVNEVVIVCAAAIWPISLLCATSFLKYCSMMFEYSEVISGYYLWLLCYCFPLGISLINAGVNFDLKSYYSLFGGCTLITIGSYLHTYGEEKKADKDIDKEASEGIDEETSFI